jgi:uncharacterized lipoprotein NlpE involved in copper resistance
MKKHFLLPLMGILSLYSCSPNNTSGAITTAQTSDAAFTDNDHSSRNALDWMGMYKGIVPCADCDGIETILYLSAGDSFVLETKYLGNGEGKVFKKAGSITWNEAGNQIRLSNLENAPNQYFVGENKLIQLDQAGNKITGQLADKYILTKQ